MTTRDDLPYFFMIGRAEDRGVEESTITRESSIGSRSLSFMSSVNV